MIRIFWTGLFAWFVLAATSMVSAESHAKSAGEDTSAKPRIMFTAIHVADLKRSLEFYTGILGMREYQRYPGTESVEVALTYAAHVPDAQPTDSGSMLLLVEREDHDSSYRHGDAFSRMAFGVSDVRAVIAAAAKAGFEIVEPAKTLSEGGLTVGFAKDPDGFLIELIGVR